MANTQKIRRSTKDERKMRWLAEHDSELQTLYAGMWLALTDDGLIATGKSYGEAYDAAEARGYTDPLVLYLREKEFAHFHPIVTVE